MGLIIKGPPSQGVFPPFSLWDLLYLCEMKDRIALFGICSPKISTKCLADLSIFHDLFCFTLVWSNNSYHISRSFASSILLVVPFLMPFFSFSDAIWTIRERSCYFFHGNLTVTTSTFCMNEWCRAYIQNLFHTHWLVISILEDMFKHMGVSKNRGTPKSSILIGFSIINHPFWGIPIFGNTNIFILDKIDFPLPCFNRGP